MDCLLIATASIAAGLIIRPFQNVPFVDDWADIDGGYVVNGWL